MAMSSKKIFLLGMLAGAACLLALGGIGLGAKHIYESMEEKQEVPYAETTDDDTVVESAGVFADNGNPVIADVDGKYKIEVVAPTGYSVGKDYESSYGTEFYNADQSIRMEYSIENNTEEEMQSYYEFDKEYFETSKDGEYTNVAISDTQTMEVNGYTVNYTALSYTYKETENDVEYCAYVMLDDATQFMCTIYGKADAVNQDLIKECFSTKLPITQ
jgi:hypothetical protein